MTESREDWRRLAEYVFARRDALGLTQADVRAAGGPSTATQRNIEGAHQASYKPRILSSLERALRWERGSVRAVLAGGEPTPLELQPTSDEALKEILAALDPEEREMVLRIRADPRKRGILRAAILAASGQDPRSTDTGRDESPGHKAS